MNADGTNKRWALPAPTPYATICAIPPGLPDGKPILLATIGLPGGAVPGQTEAVHRSSSSYVMADDQIDAGQRCLVRRDGEVHPLRQQRRSLG